MVAFNKIHQFVEDVMHGKHDFSVDVIILALTNAANAPVNTNTILANLTVIAYTNLSSRTVTTNSSGQTTGTYSLLLDDITLTASGGAVAGFRYVIPYNDTQTSPADPLICWFDYGSDLVLADGESLTVDFESDGPTTGNLFTLT